MERQFQQIFLNYVYADGSRGTVHDGRREASPSPREALMSEVTLRDDDRSSSDNLLPEAGISGARLK
mgnify:CR=1 FL=1